MVVAMAFGGLGIHLNSNGRFRICALPLPSGVPAKNFFGFGGTILPKERYADKILKCLFFT